MTVVNSLGLSVTCQSSEIILFCGYERILFTGLQEDMLQYLKMILEFVGTPEMRTPILFIINKASHLSQGHLE